MADFNIYEVGPRDGLQSLSHTVPVHERIHLIRLLADAGLRDIEAASFVNPKYVPTMANADVVFRACHDVDARLSALVPNARGFHAAREAGAERFNVFFSGDEKFNERNLGKTRQEAVADFREILRDVPHENVRVYVSLAFSSPLEGVEEAVRDAERLGHTVVLSDTDGSATPDRVRQVAGMCRGRAALHLHYGEKASRMNENLSVAYDSGIREFDSSINGLGGCPFVKGSLGNLDTADLIRWAESEGIDCGLTEQDVMEAWSFAERLRAGVPILA